MNAFDFVHAAHGRGGDRGRRRAGRGFSGRRHQSRRSDESAASAGPPKLVHIGRLAGLDRDRDAGRRRRAHRRAGRATRTSRATRASPLSRSSRRRRSSGASAQLRNAATRRRQSHAAHALRLFLRPRQRLQQARSPAPGCDAQRRETRARRASSARARLASRRTRPIFASRWSRSTRSSRSTGRPGGARSPLDAFHRLPGDAPERETEPRARRTDRRPCACRRAPPAFAGHARYLKVRDRVSYAFALASAAAALQLEAASSPRRASRSAASRRSLGARGRRKRCCRRASRQPRSLRRRPPSRAAGREARRRQRLQDRACAPRRRCAR